MFVHTTEGNFKITFPNNYTVSIYPGFGSYTDNHNQPVSFMTEPLKCSTTVEVAILKNNEIYRHPRAYVSPEELLDILNEVSKYDKAI